jgi:ribosomal subunit interface protein
MNTNIKTKAITLTPAISEHINKHISKLENIVGGDETIKCDIEVGRTTSHHNKGDIFEAEIHLVGKKHNIYATVNRPDLYQAIDEVFDEAIHSLTSTRKKYIAIARRGGAKVKNIVKGLWPWGGETEVE